MIDDNARIQIGLLFFDRLQEEKWDPFVIVATVQLAGNCNVQLLFSSVFALNQSHSLAIEETAIKDHL